MTAAASTTELRPTPIVLSHIDSVCSSRTALAAHLSGVETLLDDTTAADAEWAKLLAVPGLLESWNDVKDKWQVATEEFKVMGSCATQLMGG